jgi:uncharacterized protein
LKGKEQLNILIYGLKNGVHDYHFEVGDSFFSTFENSPITKGELRVKVALDKSDNFIKATFEIDGKIELVCDRSLESFEKYLSIQESLIFKFGDETKEISEEIQMITRDTQEINAGQLIYEFVGLAIPMKKLHPRFENETEPEGDIILVFSSEDELPDQVEETTIDPRWEKLKGLNN